MVVEGIEGIRQESRVHGAVVPQETATSMLVIVALTLIRVYFSLVVMAFARQTLQKYMQVLIMEGVGLDDYDGPFAEDLPDGEGRRGRLARLLIGMGRRYWLEGLVRPAWMPANRLRRKSSSSTGTLATEV